MVSAKKLLVISLVLLVSLVHVGCSQDQVQQVIGTVIQLTGINGGGGGGNFGGGGFLPPSGGSSGPGPANPGFPGGGSAPPSQPWDNQPQPPLPASAQQALQELQTTYGVRLVGAYREYDVMNCLNCARLYKPEFCKSLVIKYQPGGFGGGIAGTWEDYGNGGLICIWDKQGPSTTAHEMMHHVALAGVNRGTSYAKTQQMIQMNLPGRRPRNAPRHLIPTDYSLTNDDEWIAEACSLYAIKVRNLDSPYWRNSVYRTFNPDQRFREDMKYVMSEG